MTSTSLRTIIENAATGGEYGYTDLPLGDNRYQVSYTTPSQRSLRSPDAHDALKAAEAGQANDFALWHAASKPATLRAFVFPQ